MHWSLINHHFILTLLVGFVVSLLVAVMALILEYVIIANIWRKTQ